MVPRLPSQFPFFTYGRPETQGEYLYQWKLERACLESLCHRPPLTVFWVPGGDPSWNEKVVAALAGQSYPFWECRVLGGLPDGARVDTRFRPLEVSGWGAETVNGALESVPDGWVFFLGPDSLPSPSAFFQWVREVGEGEWDLAVGQTAWINSAATAIRGAFRHGGLRLWDLVHGDYLRGAMLVRREWLLKTGGVARLPLEDSLYELALRAGAQGARVFGLSSVVLYRRDAERWRPSPALLKVLDAHLEGMGWEGEVGEPGSETEPLVLTPRLRPTDLVSAVVCFRNRAAWTSECLEGLALQRGVSLEVVLVDHDSDPTSRERVEATARRLGLDYRILDYSGPFHFARMNNRAVEEVAKGNLLLLLNNDVALSDPHEVAELAAWARVPGVGTVAPRLQKPDGGFQSDGIRVAAGGVGRMSRVGHVMGETWHSRGGHQVGANSFALVALSRECYERLGGLDETRWVNGFGDVAFCLRAGRLGYTHLCLGHRVAQHRESGSRGVPYEFWQEKELEAHFGPELVAMAQGDLTWWTPGEGKRAAGRALSDAARAVARERFPLANTARQWLRKGLKGLAQWGNNPEL